MIKLAIFCIVVGALNINAVFHDDERCSCTCPGLNGTDKAIFLRTKITPSECNCKGLVLPHLGAQINGSEQVYCRACDCKFETRNNTLIMVVTQIEVWIIVVLFIYRVCVKFYHHYINQQRANQLLNNIEQQLLQERIILLFVADVDSD